MSIEFPLPLRWTPFGVLSDPRIYVTVLCPSRERRYRFLLDTGASFAAAPRRLAEQAGLRWSNLPEIRVTGIELGQLRARLGRLPIRVGGIELVVRCLFIDNPRTPFILGRADFFERFVVTFDLPGGKVILVER